jgi:uncharacterized repeat protein (TIGR01451 family)
MNRFFLAAESSVFQSRLFSPQSSQSRWSRPITQFTLCLLSTTCLMSMIVYPAIANQIPTSSTTWTGTGTTAAASKDTPSGLRTTISVSGSGMTMGVRNNNSLQTVNTTTAPSIPSATNGIQVLVTANSSCSNTALFCNNLGTVNFNFTDSIGNPIFVKNPVIHMSRLGGFLGYTSGAISANYNLGGVLTLTTPGASLGPAASGARGFLVAGGNKISPDLASFPTNSTTIGGCTATPAAPEAGCGSIPVTGLVSSLGFNVDLTRSNASGNWQNIVTGIWAADGIYFTVSLDEDYGDAPASFDTGGAASHIISDLSIGSTIDVDNINTTNGGATGTPLVALSPNAVAAGANNNGSSGDGVDEDGVTTWNPLTTTATTYSTTVPLSGVNRAARVCGWVDFNRNNAFDNPTERACADVVSGQTSAVLNWTGLAGLTAGNNYARLRLSYDLTGVQNPKGPLNSGEVEDYQIAIAAVARPTASALALTCPINTVSIASLDAGATNNATTITYPNAGAGGRTMTVRKTSGTNTVSGSSSSPNIYKLGTGSPVGGIWLGNDDLVARSMVGRDTETYEVFFDGDITAFNMTFSAINGNTDGIEHIKILNVYNAAGTDITGTTNYGFVDATPAGFGSLSFFTDTQTLEPTTYADVTAGGTYGNSNGTITLQNATGMRRVVFQRLEPGNPNSTDPEPERSNGVGLGPIVYCNTAPPDRSDAPTSGTAPNGTGTNSYGEATHTVVAGTRLGTAIDSDAAAIANATASGDGADDDGISSFPTLNAGATSYNIPVANIAATGTGTLHAWIDFNKNGTFDAGEYSSVAVTNNTPAGALNWTGITAGAGGNTFARFRFTSDATITASTPSGLAADGEVEDYQVAIAALPITIDYGDAPQDLSSIDASLNPAYPTLLANSGASHTIDGVHYLGAGVTGDTNGQPTLNADGDTQDDGVTFPTTGNTPILSVGQSNSITVNASTTGVLNAWIDWNQNGVWEASEQIATNQAMTAGNNSITVTPGDTAPHGKTYARFRFSTQSNLQPSGTATDGEVEDYVINVVIPEITTCTAPLMNAGFEFPKISGATPTPIQFYPNIKLYKEADVPGWAAISNNPNATFSQIAVISPFNQRNAIELWGIGNSYNVQPYEGQQFAEINAYVFGRLYQDLITIPGSKMRWQFAHRGRDGSDTIRVKFGAPGATTDQGTYTTARTGWQVYTGSYTIPAGQTITRFEFEAVSSATGDTAQGNFIDDIQFGIDCPKPNPNLLLVKRITAINGGTSTLGGDSLAGYINSPTNPYDDNTLTIPTQNTPTDPARDTVNWPSLNTFMRGGINGGNIKPNDEIEYSIYFLSTGDGDATNVLLCDRIPANVTFIPRAFNGQPTAPGGLGTGDRGILFNQGTTTGSLSNISDGDIGQYLAPGISIGSVYPSLGNSCGTNDNGAIVVNLGTIPKADSPGTPPNSYGFIRFRGRVK